MNLLIEDPVPQKSFFKKPPVLIGIVLIAFALTALVAFVAYQKLSEEKEGPQDIVQEATPQEQLDALYTTEAMPQPPQGADPLNYGLPETSPSTEGLDGYILFTGLLKEEKPNNTNQVYFLDASQEGSLPSLFFPESILYSAYIEFTDLQSPTEFFVKAMHYDISELPEGLALDDYGIQKYDVADGSLKAYKSIRGTYTQNPAWSESAQKLAYARLKERPERYSDQLSVDAWEVVISDPATDSVVATLDGAVQPKWSPDGSKIVVLKKDGLYVYDIASGSEAKITDITDGQMLATSMFDISADGTHLVWTVAQKGMIVMYEIMSWEPFTVREIGRIHEENTEYYWPQFSPDGEHYVVQAINSALPGATQRENPRFEIRATLSRSVLHSYSLDQFDFNSFFTDTWVEELPQASAMLGQR